jgi:hypothetical protein
MPNSPPHAPTTRQLRLCRRALQGKSAGPAPSQYRNRPPVSCHRRRGDTSSAAPTSGRQVRLDNPSNTPDETDYQSSAAAQLRPKPPSLPHKKSRNITIAGRTPADRNAASVQPMERANGIQSSSRRHPKEGSDDVDAVVRPDRALGFHPKSWNRGCAGGGLHGGASKEVTRRPRTPTPSAGKSPASFRPEHRPTPHPHALHLR